MTCVYNNSRRTLSNMCVQRDISRETRRGTNGGNVTARALRKSRQLLDADGANAAFIYSDGGACVVETPSGALCKTFSKQIFPYAR